MTVPGYWWGALIIALIAAAVVGWDARSLPGGRRRAWLHGAGAAAIVLAVFAAAVALTFALFWAMAGDVIEIVGRLRGRR